MNKELKGHYWQNETNAHNFWRTVSIGGSTELPGSQQS